jgi:hypothetical protein
MRIWDFQSILSRRLLMWSGISSVLGVIMFVGGKFWRGVGSQFVGWAAVNAAIAIGGRIATEKRRSGLENPDQPKVLIKEGNNLQRLLWINAGLDVFYMLGGAWMLSRNPEKPAQRGAGLGIIIQGAFLFIFDIIHALRTPTWPWEGDNPR